MAVTNLDEVAPLTPNAWLRFDVIERLLPAGVTDVLEIGCGQGALGVRLADRFDYLGVEPDGSSFAVAEWRKMSSFRQVIVSPACTSPVFTTDR